MKLFKSKKEENPYVSTEEIIKNERIGTFATAEGYGAIIQIRRVYWESVHEYFEQTLSLSVNGKVQFKDDYEENMRTKISDYLNANFQNTRWKRID